MSTFGPSSTSRGGTLERDGDETRARLAKKNAGTFDFDVTPVGGCAPVPEMTPKVLLRIAAGAISLNELGHTLGGMILAESHGPEEETLLAALAAYRFDVMGSMRSHYEFYRGEGWYLSATLAAMIALCVILSNAVSESPALVRRLSLVVALFFAVSTALCLAFFFIAPLVTSVVASLSCTAAWWRLRSA